jgi:preprotein translocase subunit SecE
VAQASSSNGRASDSKSECWGFESLLACTIGNRRSHVMNENREEQLESTSATTFGLMKYVHLTFLTGAFAVGWLLTRSIQAFWTFLNLRIPEVPTADFTISVVIGVVISLSLGFYLWKNAQVNRLVVEIISELSKVTWPTRKELYASTVVVIVVSVIAAIILGLYDAFWSWVTGFIY